MPNRPVARAAATLLALAFLSAASADAQPAAPVAITTASSDTIVQEVALTGSLSSPRRARLAPEVEGRVTEVLVDAGARVADGDPLLRLDQELSRIELRQAEASVREARANLADARRRLREAENLAARDTIGQSELETRRAEVQQLEAALMQREAERDFRTGMLERHTLNAPFPGVINQRMIDIGERASPDEPVFELIATERLRLDLAIPQSYFGAVTTDTAVRIRVDARPDAPIEGRIDTIIPVSDSGSRTFRARVELDNSDGHLTPGMSARATLRIQTGSSGVVIPQDALMRYPDGRTVVWIAEGDGTTRTVREQQVRTGLQFDGRISVREGLEAGTPIVTEGNEALQDGQEVRITRTE